MTAASRSKPKRSVEIPYFKIIAVMAVIVAIFFILDLGRRSLTGLRVQQEKTRLEQELVRVESTYEALLAHKDYVASDQYAEMIARNELKWSLPGEKTFVILATPIAQPQVAPEAPPIVLPERNTPSPLQAWLDLLLPTN